MTDLGICSLTNIWYVCLNTSIQICFRHDIVVLHDENDLSTVLDDGLMMAGSELINCVLLISSSVPFVIVSAVNFWTFFASFTLFLNAAAKSALVSMTLPDIIAFSCGGELLIVLSPSITPFWSLTTAARLELTVRAMHLVLIQLNSRCSWSKVVGRSRSRLEDHCDTEFVQTGLQD